MTPGTGRLFGLVVCLATMVAPAALAQNEPRFALVGSLPSPTVSLQWEVSEKFALRFDGSYSYRDESLDDSIDVLGGASEYVYADGTISPVVFAGASIVFGGITSQSTVHSGSIGITGLFTLYRIDRLRLYVAPRVSLAWSRLEFTTTVPSIPTLSGPLISSITETRTESRTSPGAGAAFGATTNIHRHVALFGEVGVSYWRNNSPAPGFSVSALRRSESKSTSVGTLAMAGVMLLF